MQAEPALRCLAPLHLAPTEAAMSRRSSPRGFLSKKMREVRLSAQWVGQVNEDVLPQAVVMDDFDGDGDDELAVLIPFSRKWRALAPRLPLRAIRNRARCSPPCYSGSRGGLSLIPNATGANSRPVRCLRSERLRVFSTFLSRRAR